MLLNRNQVRLVTLYINDLDNLSLEYLLKNIFKYNKLFQKGKPTYKKSEYNGTLFRITKIKKTH